MTKRKTKATRTPAKAALPERRAPSEAETAAVTAAKVRQAERPVRVGMVHDFDAANGTLRIDAPHSDRVGWYAHLLETFGTTSADFANASSAHIANAVTPRGERFPSDSQKNAALAVMGAVAPRDELEALLGVQIVAAHEASLDFMRRARLNAGEYMAAAATYAGMATKLSRTMTAQIEALAKLRTGGKQTYEVKHVHVHGPAFFGSHAQAVFTGGGGVPWGSIGRSLGRSHATPAIAGSAPSADAALWSADPARLTLHGSRGE